MTRLLVCLMLIATLAPAQVQVWQGSMRLPAYEEGPPDPNPPFDTFATGRFNYPYTLRENLTGNRVVQEWRALFLENEYLKCSVLPDVGGHLYSCTDKISGREMFYANPSLKKAKIGYRGAWAAFGIEFNYPVSHNWMSMSPVDFATAQNHDGSASVWVGNTDRPYGMRWTVELILRPGSTVLEQRVRLSNPSPVRHRFYWWNNAGLEVWDNSRICYPMRWTASHGFADVDTWPVDRTGRDLSVIANQTAGPVSRFAYGSREPFMGVYHPKTDAGTVHYAEYAELPHKKIWAWGVDADGLDWRKQLSDNESAYIEIQAGLFRNQETYAFLDPQGTIEFSEYWMPVRETGGITRANLAGVVHMRRELKQLDVDLNVNRVIEGGTVRIRAGNRELHKETLRLDPKTVWRKSVDQPAEKATFELLDGKGNVLLAHTEDQFDWAPESDIKTGARTPLRLPGASARSEGDWIEAGQDQELNGDKLAAMETYEQGLSRFPRSFLLERAAGRLAVDLKRFEEAVRWLRSAQARVSNDENIHYYLGLALQQLGRDREARTEFEGAYRMPKLRDAARTQLGAMAARAGDLAQALKLLEGTKWELAVLRKMKREYPQTRDLWLRADPADSFVRLESADESLWRHLAAEPDRVIDLAARYTWLGMPEDALALLERKYPEVPAAEREPGTLLPQDSPLVSYFRGYVRRTMGQPGKEDFDLASKQKLDYVFPNRPAMMKALGAALQENAGDASAHYLLGLIYMSGGRVEDALAAWDRARKLNSSIPILHRNIARTLLEVKSQPDRAAEVYREGLGVDPKNVELYSGLTQSLALLGRPAAERVAALEKYPDPASSPAPLVYDLALSFAESGRFADAEKLFPGRYFAREEGGTNPREVWLEVQLQKALTAKDAKLVRQLGKPVPGVDFTKDGMDSFTRGARFNYLAGLAADRAGDRALAQEHWTKAAADSRDLAYAYEAAKLLPGFDEAVWRVRLEEHLKALGHTGEESGALHLQRGMLLRALGRGEQAKKAFRAAILAPERGITRYQARVELNRAS